MPWPVPTLLLEPFRNSLLQQSQWQARRAGRFYGERVSLISGLGREKTAV
jgi:hypothetical protein